MGPETDFDSASRSPPMLQHPQEALLSTLILLTEGRHDGGRAIEHIRATPANVARHRQVLGEAHRISVSRVGRPRDLLCCDSEVALDRPGVAEEAENTAPHPKSARSPLDSSQSPRGAHEHTRIRVVMHWARK